ncbi:hypothetical protein CAFE_25610 [Caprobacter fermentans]|uniref:Uncharacterized protein n=1 Tax=Caproicibacter fermentans TaxID=2576756 RepID=A0A6N8I2R8_9FIRM|nr:hypothetical protein [Caproicibacter fermentans]MVB11833.1 hypothetical protein [Caproicibacter fermentans]
MDQNTQTLMTILGVVVIFALITVAAVKFGTKKNAVAAMGKVLTGLGYAQAVATALTPFLPGITGTVINKVLTYAQQAVTRVEATYKAALVTGSAADDTRTAEATSLIKSALALDGIEDTEQIDKLINTVIPLLVLALPKTHTAAAVESGAVASDTTGAV